MNTTQIQGIFLNLIIYLIIISLNKKIYISKQQFFTTIIYCTLLEISLSLILYIFPKDIFSTFTKTTGIINFAIYSSKILFISSSLFALKILIPAYLYNQNKKKKLAILVLSKIAITIISIIILYIKFNTKGILFSIPICDFIFYIIYFLNIIR